MKLLFWFYHNPNILRRHAHPCITCIRSTYNIAIVFRWFRKKLFTFSYEWVCVWNGLYYLKGHLMKPKLALLYFQTVQYLNAIYFVRWNVKKIKTFYVFIFNFYKVCSRNTVKKNSFRHSSSNKTKTLLIYGSNYIQIFISKLILKGRGKIKKKNSVLHNSR